MAKTHKSTAVALPTTEDKWQAEDDFRTLTRADEVTSDRGRLSKARAHGKRQLKSLARVLGGRR